jgi:hypothetical protein
VSASDTDSTAYTAGVVGIEALVQAVPNLLTVANIQGSQVSRQRLALTLTSQDANVTRFHTDQQHRIRVHERYHRPQDG